MSSIFLLILIIEAVSLAFGILILYYYIEEHYKWFFIASGVIGIVITLYRIYTRI